MDFSQFFDTSDPNNAMKLGMLSGLLQSSGYSTTPQSFGQTIGNALQGGMQGQQMSQQAAYRNMQAQQMKQAMERQKRMDEMVAGVFGGQSSPSIASGFQQGENAGIPNGQTPQMTMPQQPIQPQGIGNADINKLAMLRAMGGQDLLPFYQEANKPQVIEQGKTYRYKDGRTEFMPQLPEGAQYNPQTGAITEVQGYTPMMARRTGAIEGAKQWAGVQPAIATTQGQEWAKVAPQTQLAGNQAAITSANTPMDVVLPDGSKVVMPRSQVLGGMQTQQGSMPFTSQQSPSTQEWQQGRAKENVANYSALQQNAATASAQISKLNRIDELLQGVGGGKIDPLGREIASTAASLGFTLDKNLGNKQAAEALAIQVANGMRQPGTGVMTDKDFENFKAATPDLAKTPEGRAQMMNTMRGFLNRDVAESQMADKYVQKYGKLDDKFYSQLNQWRSQNPIFGGK